MFGKIIKKKFTNELFNESVRMNFLPESYLSKNDYN